MRPPKETRAAPSAITPPALFPTERLPVTSVPTYAPPYRVAPPPTQMPAPRLPETTERMPGKPGRPAPSILTTAPSEQPTPGPEAGDGSGATTTGPFGRARVPDA